MVPPKPVVGPRVNTLPCGRSHERHFMLPFSDISRGTICRYSSPAKYGIGGLSLCTNESCKCRIVAIRVQIHRKARDITLQRQEYPKHKPSLGCPRREISADTVSPTGDVDMQRQRIFASPLIYSSKRTFPTIYRVFE